jgi:hypothetical protein
MKTKLDTKAPAYVPAKSRFLRRKRILKGARDAQVGLKDTERRGTPNDVPAARRRRV